MTHILIKAGASKHSQRCEQVCSHQNLVIKIDVSAVQADEIDGGGVSKFGHTPESDGRKTNSDLKETLTIDGVQIERYEEKLFRINDLHKASGGLQKDRPPYFLRLKSTEKIIEALPGERWEKVHVIHGGLDQGSYFCRALAYAYAMWVSPVFFVKVIEALSREGKPGGDL
ncbi:KilA-N domain-containing protein [Erwinia sp. S38]|uniref:KilA-N domain-containing protein n=1 Tax=Erwinia sp. S38 TaxID=2769338 RepID=UPI00190C9027|nr:KilA-N domain-containing protein [Erwinia sp. S38]MBK0004357.1 KilA-N domain-containing protein [Erwinia sp. S38]